MTAHQLGVALLVAGLIAFVIWVFMEMCERAPYGDEDGL